MGRVPEQPQEFEYVDPSVNESKWNVIQKDELLGARSCYISGVAGTGKSWFLCNKVVGTDNKTSTTTENKTTTSTENKTTKVICASILQKEGCKSAITISTIAAWASDRLTTPSRPAAETEPEKYQKNQKIVPAKSKKSEQKQLQIQPKFNPIKHEPAESRGAKERPQSSRSVQTSAGVGKRDRRRFGLLCLLVSGSASNRAADRLIQKRKGRCRSRSCTARPRASSMVKT